jgi:hypothetical protein
MVVILPRPKKNAVPGYHSRSTDLSRHRAIKKAARTKKESAMALSRHFQLLSTLTKRTQPEASKVYKRNSEWIKKALI